MSPVSRLQYYWMNVQFMALSLFLPQTPERRRCPES